MIMNRLLTLICILVVFVKASTAAVKPTHSSGHNESTDENTGISSAGNTGISSAGKTGLQATMLARNRRSDDAEFLCYTCIYSEHSPDFGCLDPMYEFNVKTVPCKGFCGKSIRRFPDSTRVSRGCWDVCSASNTENSIRTCCKTERCNSAHRLHNTGLAAFLAFLFSVRYFLL